MTVNPPAVPLVLFSIGNLVLGTGAFVLGGILGDVSADLGVSVASAGQAMTAYALATALLAPLLLVATGRLNSKHAMALALGVFATGNLVCALANGLPMLLAGRVLMGAGAIFTPLAAGMVVVGTPVAQRGRALSFVFLGISMSYVVGLPLGNWLAALQNWRLPIFVIAGASVTMLLALVWRVPQALRSPPASFKGVGSLVRQREVALTLGLTLLYFTAIFNVFAYIGPVLNALGTTTVTRVALTLLLFGVSGVVGTLLGGLGTDRLGPVKTLRLQMGVFLVAQVALPFTAGNYGLMLAMLLTWGTAGFGMMPPQQTRLAGASPTHAPVLLSLNTSMLYLGTAAGSIVGGLSSAWLGFEHQAWTSTPFTLLGLLTLFLKQRQTNTGAP